MFAEDNRICNESREQAEMSGEMEVHTVEKGNKNQ